MHTLFHRLKILSRPGGSVFIRPRQSSGWGCWRSTICWDYDFDALSWSRHRDLIVRRVLRQGSWQAIGWLRCQMGDDLQARTLESLQCSGAMVPLAFHRGMALRFLYAIPRYSEDLDFALERPGTGYDFRAHLRAVQDEFVKEGYQVGIKAKPLPIWPGSALCRRYEPQMDAHARRYILICVDRRASAVIKGLNAAQIRRRSPANIFYLN